ncbi:CDP-alcohol phosphatidyltransferase family protein [Lentithecium fluviatile CBS 122367]|uniref:CDP-alcohol phosphatidyltransferase family protein n=1 Tax=Lentithecium fluviatile CBS 122367 TaxID=1168545 RepID=A0A6G1IK01_9PLEO|nr:CDP-alcohol phosphatidyltransferase family protein [Lentithecium fluviatile CBS 122367]
MLDIQLRPLKDRLFDSITPVVPLSITPLHITLLAFVCGVQSCICAASSQAALSLGLWVLNRAFDCLDGAVARHRRQASDLGGFLDLLGDFIVYSAIPIACALSSDNSGPSLWLSVAVLEASFHVNNFVLFYVAAIVEKRKALGGENNVKELTSLAMRPALIEGAESAVFFTAMLAWPQYLAQISWCMAFLVCVGIIQRNVWLAKALS